VKKNGMAASMITSKPTAKILFFSKPICYLKKREWPDAQVALWKTWSKPWPHSRSHQTIGFHHRMRSPDEDRWAHSRSAKLTKLLMNSCVKSDKAFQEIWYRWRVKFKVRFSITIQECGCFSNCISGHNRSIPGKRLLSAFCLNYGDKPMPEGQNSPLDKYMILSLVDTSWMNFNTACIKNCARL
jgi:hypothetical protein